MEERVSFQSKHNFFNYRILFITKIAVTLEVKIKFVPKPKEMFSILYDFLNKVLLLILQLYVKLNDYTVLRTYLRMYGQCGS